MNSIMKKLQYTKVPSENNYQKYREYIRVNSDYSCAYCTITESESPGATFNLDHFRPVKYFLHLKTDCNNLRYACPRCNSYKRDNWIPKEIGCINNCESCKTKICTRNIYRFIDCLKEEPNNFIEMDVSGELKVINGSKPAIYTIKCLRLNRAQLIKLRSVRRFLELWRQELLQMLEEVKNQIVDIELQFNEFNTIFSKGKFIKLKDEEQLLIEVAKIQFEMLFLQAHHSKDFIESELQRLEYISDMRLGSDTGQSL